MKKEDLSYAQQMAEIAELKLIDPESAEILTKLVESVQRLKEAHENATPDEIESLKADPEFQHMRSMWLAELEDSLKKYAELSSKAEAASSEISEMIAEAEKYQS